MFQGSTMMPRSPLAIRGRWIGKTLRLSGMNAPGYDSAGEGIDQIVSGRFFGGASVSASGRPARANCFRRKMRPGA